MQDDVAERIARALESIAETLPSLAPLDRLLVDQSQRLLKEQDARQAKEFKRHLDEMTRRDPPTP